MSDCQFDYECPECSKGFSTFEETQEHCFDIHDIEIEAEEEEDVTFDNNLAIDIKQPTKPITNTTNTSNTATKTTTIAANPDKMDSKYVASTAGIIDDTVKVDKYVCKNAVCKASNVSFGTFDEFEDHLNLVHGAFKCIGCDTRYRRKVSYENHIKKYHDGVEPTEYAKKTRSRKTTGEKTTKKSAQNDGAYYSCRFCPKIYASKSSLQHHYTLKHENDDNITSNDLDNAIRTLIDTHL